MGFGARWVEAGVGGDAFDLLWFEGVTADDAAQGWEPVDQSALKTTPLAADGDPAWGTQHIRHGGGREYCRQGDQ
jgi:hypothetical protein